MNVSRHAVFNPHATPADVRSAFERFFNRDDADSSSVVTSQWSPAVDIREEPQRFVILADIPGVDP
ncbi:MAG: Hsp20/alpha crystallin family protein, partial [Dokdonella sp.]